MLRINKPKILYRYSGRNLEKHKLTKECVFQIEADNQYGVLFRCRGLLEYPLAIPPRYHDSYGYATLKEAKKEAIDNTMIEIYDLQLFLKKITKELNKV